MKNGDMSKIENFDFSSFFADIFADIFDPENFSPKKIFFCRTSNSRNFWCRKGISSNKKNWIERLQFPTRWCGLERPGTIKKNIIQWLIFSNIFVSNPSIEQIVAIF